jgi:hypothetical protein
MKAIQIDNIFNYIPQTIRREMNDDDLIKSWTLQAFRLLNFKGYQYERAIEFVSLSGYKGELPSDFLSAHKVSILTGTSNPQGLASIFECEDCEDEREENRESPCPLTHRFVLSRIYEEPGWQTMKYTPNIGPNFFCRANVDSCQKIWSMKGGEIYASAKDGLLAIEYYRFLRDEQENIMLPQEPQVLWSYLSGHVQRRYLEDKRFQVNITNINEARSLNGLSNMYQTAMMQEVSYLSNLRAQLMLSNMKIENIQAIQSGGIVRTANLMRRHLTTYYAI